MDYRFEISKPDSNDFRCEIAINGEQTFQQLHDKLVETLNFDGSQMASFFTLDKMGNRGKENCSDGKCRPTMKKIIIRW